jgi:hypothetical protein
MCRPLLEQAIISGRVTVSRPPPMAPVLRAARSEADQAAQLLATPGVEVVPLVAVHGAQVPWQAHLSTA